jgi:colicin import membrane protein
MGRADGTPRAVVWSALLHVGIVAFLALATLNCARWEAMADFLHLPQSMRRVTCTRIKTLKGPVIEATLVGPAQAPPPPPVQHAPKTAPRKVQKPEPKLAPTPKPKPKPKPPSPSAPAQVLPKPVPHPKLKNQQKVVEQAKQKAEEAKRAQEEEHKQHMAELAQKRKAQKLLKQLAKAQAESRAQQHRVDLEEQKAQQLADLRKAKNQQHNTANVPAASKARTGQSGSNNAAYVAALQNAITKNWQRPYDISTGTVCPVEIVQTRGGQVISAKVMPSCPFNEAGKHSVEAAVLRSSPLPYKGFEKQFRPDIKLNFTVPSSR